MSIMNKPKIFNGRYEELSKEVFYEYLREQQGDAPNRENKRYEVSHPAFKSAWGSFCDVVCNPMVKLIGGVLLMHIALIYLLIR